MQNTIIFEAYQTVPVVTLSDMTPYMQTVADSQQAFPIPGEEFSFMRLDLSLAIIRNPTHTFFIKLTENSLAAAGYPSGDIALVDRMASPRNKDVIIAYLEGEFIIRRLKITEEMFILESDEDTQEIEPDASFSIWGVVVDVLNLKP